MQCNTSLVILDPKGELCRDTGYLFEKKGYDVRILDLINMGRSHGYNPFAYIRDANDVLKLIVFSTLIRYPPFTSIFPHSTMIVPFGSVTT